MNKVDFLNVKYNIMMADKFKFSLFFTVNSVPDETFVFKQWSDKQTAIDVAWSRIL